MIKRQALSRCNQALLQRCCGWPGFQRALQTQPRKSAWKPASARVFLTLGLGATACTLAILQPRMRLDAGPTSADNTRKLRLSELKKHGAGADRIWVHRRNRVYDITDWVPAHPGGEVILRAAGGSIDQYWKIFSIHQKQDVYDILEEYYIGDIDPRDLVNGAVPQEEIDDPFKDDPLRDPRLITHTERPRNAETPEECLNDFITPTEVFYVRNHLWVPPDDKNYTLNLELQDGTEKSYTLHELRTRFQERELTATLQCSGNRRSHMTRNSRTTNGLQWDCGAIGTATWKGVYLRDVLADVGFPVNNPPEESRHVQFMGAEAYGASIPIHKVLDPRGEVLLAYEMNDEPLSRDHGYPLRMVVPGTVAARSVKWVRNIVVSDEESHSQWQRRDYKSFGPNEGANPNWDAAVSIQETPVQSAITLCKEIAMDFCDSSYDKETLRAWSLQEDSVALEGYAFAGGGRAIVRVDVSVDGGHTWNQADLLEEPVKGKQSWSWKRWKYACPKRDVDREIVIKAVDEAYNTQPETYSPQYNFRGNLTTAWHRIPFGPEKSSGKS